MGYFEVNKLALKVLKNSGFDVTSGSNIKETTLLYDDQELNAPTFYFNNGYNGIEFEVSVVIKENYYYDGRPFMEYLNQWDKWNTVVSVVTSAMDVPNGKYVMRIKNKSQTIESRSIWKLRFKQFYENSLSFESMYSYKGKSLSAVDSVLSKYSNIHEYSPREAILALQKKLLERGCWSSVKYDKYGRAITIATPDGPEFMRRVPDGYWDYRMQYDIFSYQQRVGIRGRNGVCDADTIASLLDDWSSGSV